MFRKIAMTAVLAVVLSASAFAQASVAGGWDLSINGPEGPINATCTLKQDGNKVSGTLESPQGTVNLAGELKGKNLSMNFSLQTPQGSLEIKVTSYGLLTLGGLVSLVAGSLMLVDHAAAPGLRLSLELEAARTQVDLEVRTALEVYQRRLQAAGGNHGRAALPDSPLGRRSF